MGYARTYSIQPDYPYGTIVTIEVDTHPGLYSFTIAGLGDTSLHEARERVGSAIAACNYTSPRYSNIKTTVLLSPSTLKKEGSHYDLGIACAFLIASKQIKVTHTQLIFLGEINLDGSVLPIHLPHTCGRTLANSDMFNDYHIICHPDTAVVISKFGLNTVAVTSLNECVSALQNLSNTRTLSTLRSITSNNLLNPEQNNSNTSNVHVFKDIIGHHHAQRALFIAIVGSHHSLLFGPPGSGKTLLADCAAQLLPPLSNPDELIHKCIYEHSHKNTNKSYQTTAGLTLENNRIRKPHHSIGISSLIGGRLPGELSKSYKGLLILNELGEFNKKCLEALREPLEDGVVHIVRHGISRIDNSECCVIATMNPCACGYLGSKIKPCSCLPTSRAQHIQKVSEPLLERFSICCRIDAHSIENMSANSSDNTHSEIFSQYRTHVSQQFMFKRNLKVFGKRIPNGYLRQPTMNQLCFDMVAQDFFVSYIKKIRVSHRSARNLMCVARTIADIAQSITVDRSHVAEAVRYRTSLPRDS